jgi:phosphoribosylanthranilate isomerase
MIRAKICGIRRTEDALLAAELGAWAIGFVFWPGSIRCVAAPTAREIVAALPPFVTAIGVFVNQPREDVLAIADTVKLGGVQLHGDETTEWYAGFPYRVIKTVPVPPSFDDATLAHVPAWVTVLLDAHDPIRRGGTGRTIDWSLAASAARARPVILSGGLTPENVRTAVDTVRPHAVDVSSGVESSPGVKDPGKLRAFFSALQS